MPEATPLKTNAAAAAPAGGGFNAVTSSDIATNPAVQQSIAGLNFGGITPTTDQANQAIQSRIKDMQAQMGVSSSSTPTRNGIAELDKSLTDATKQTPPGAVGGVTADPVTGKPVYGVGPDGKPLVAEGYYDTTKLKDRQAEQDKMYADREAQMKEEQARQLEEINRQADAARQGRIETQKREAGKTSVDLARMGGYLGGSGSGQAVMTSLEVAHRNELDTLDKQRNTALQEARNAFNAKNFELARQKAADARDIYNDMSQRDKEFQSYKMDMYKEEKQGYQFGIQEERAKRKEELDKRQLDLAEQKEKNDAEQFTRTENYKIMLDAAKSDQEMAKNLYANTINFSELPAAMKELMARVFGTSVEAIDQLPAPAKLKLAQEAASRKEILDNSRLELEKIRTLAQVPRNTTVVIGGQEQQGLKPLRGGTGGTTPFKVTQAQQSDFENANTALRNGQDWGSVWNNLKRTYPELANDAIDAGLDTRYRNTGQFQYEKGQTSEATAAGSAQGKSEAAAKAREAAKNRRK